MWVALGRGVSLCICCRVCCSNGFDLGVLREPAERFVTAQLSLHPIERPLLCQTRANRFRRFATMPCHVFEFMRQFFVCHVDAFRRRDAVNNQFRLHVVLGAFLLPFPQRPPTHVHCPRVHSLRRQRPHHAL